MITGQSFGAGAVAAQITSPLSKGLFRGAMMTSACNFGGAGLIGGAAPLADGEKAGLDLQKRLGAADLAAMRNVPADQILALQEENQLGLSVSGVRAPAVIDGYFWTGTKEQAFASHQASDVPVIASSNGDDLDSARYPLTRARTVAEYQAMARQMYATEADAFLQLYPAQTDADVQPMAHRAAMENGMMMNSRSCAEMQAKHGKAPVYIDTFMRKHPYAPGVKIADQDPATVGAYHTADVPYWFDTLDTYNWQRPTRVWTAYDRELTDRMAGALIALAETGSPVTPQLNWPAWTAAIAAIHGFRRYRRGANHGSQADGLAGRAPACAGNACECAAAAAEGEGLALCCAGQSRRQFCAAQPKLDAHQIEVGFDGEEQVRVLHRNREQVDRPVDAREVRFECRDIRACEHPCAGSLR